MAIVSKKCNRCRKPMRNDGTEEQPIWVCNNKKCVKYKEPPKENPPAESTPATEEGTSNEN